MIRQVYTDFFTTLTGAVNKSVELTSFHPLASFYIIFKINTENKTTLRLCEYGEHTASSIFGVVAQLDPISYSNINNYLQI